MLIQGLQLWYEYNNINTHLSGQVLAVEYYSIYAQLER